MRTAILAILLINAAASVHAQAPEFKGKLDELTIPSRSYPSGRHAWVYTPPGYPAVCRGGCNLILAFDGAQYIVAMPLPHILDSLVDAKRTPPTVAVLFDNGAPPPRLQDLANSSRFAAFVAEELVPWVREHYVVARVPDHTIITGSSAGGLGAAYIASKYPGLFGNVLSQSGAFWRGNEGSNDPPYEWLTEQLASSPKVNVHFFLDVGSTETRGAMGGSAPSLVGANRRLRDVMKAKGYVVDYYEVPGGEHHPLSWGPRLPFGIVALAPLLESTAKE